MSVLTKFFGGKKVALDLEWTLDLLKDVPRKDWRATLAQAGRGDFDNGVPGYYDDLLDWALGAVKEEMDRRESRFQASLEIMLPLLLVLAVIASFVGYNLYQKRARRLADERYFNHVRQAQSRALASKKPEKATVSISRQFNAREFEVGDDSAEIEVEEAVRSINEHSHEVTSGKTRVGAKMRVRKSIAAGLPTLTSFMQSPESSVNPAPAPSLTIKVNNALVNFLLSELKEAHYLPGDHSCQGYPRTLFTMFWPEGDSVVPNASEKLTKIAKNGQSGVVLYSSSERGKNGYDAKLKLLGSHGKSDIRYLARLHKAVGCEKQYGVLLFDAEKTESHKSLQRMKKK